jgi:hypothetical protein
MAALAGAPALSRAASSGSQAEMQLAASWQSGSGYQVGVLSKTAAHANAIEMAVALDVPTRAHGLLLEPGGTLLAVARRPGDWLLRWNRDGAAIAWHWIEPRRAFSGHVLAGMDGRRLYTTEIELDTGAGFVGVRDAVSLKKLDEWPTHGIDPHQLVWDATCTSSLIVANGGVPTQPETGRVKRDMDRMDSSLVRLDAETGKLLGQWRLADNRLSLRHLAWNTAMENRPVLGIALQAEHDTAEEKMNASVLGLFDGRALHAVQTPRPLSGYGGDITAMGSHFAVSCPRAHGIALFGVNAGWHGMAPLNEACALASTPRQMMAAGRQHALGLHPASAVPAHEIGIPAIRLDNHWIVL